MLKPGPLFSHTERQSETYTDKSHKALCMKTNPYPVLNLFFYVVQLAFLSDLCDECLAVVISVGMSLQSHCSRSPWVIISP